MASCRQVRPVSEQRQGRRRLILDIAGRRSIWCRLCRLFSMMFGRRRRHRASDRSGVPRPPAGEHPFTIVRNGYSTTEVAAFLTEISSDTTVLRPQDLRRVAFRVDRRGYDKAEVLAYLTRVAAELEAELETARSKLRRKRLANIDPALVEAEPIGAPSPTGAVLAPDPQKASQEEPDIEIFTVQRPGRPGGPSPAPATDLFAVERPAAPAEPSAQVHEASEQIAALLRESHDHALRLRTQAEADVRSTIDAAQAEVDQRRRSQMRELDEQRHQAELEAHRRVSTAQIEADTIRAAAQAVLTQARAEIEAVKALAQHNMAEIEEARSRAISDSRQMLALGRGMLQSVVDLDRMCALRLRESDERVRELLGGGAI